MPRALVPCRVYGATNATADGVGWRDGKGLRGEMPTKVRAQKGPEAEAPSDILVAKLVAAAVDGVHKGYRGRVWRVMEEEEGLE